MLGQLRNRRTAPHLYRKLLNGPVDRKIQFLKAPRNLDGPALVPKVALYLTDNRWRGVGRKFHTTVEIEPINRFEQTHGADLNQIIERLSAVGKLHREIAHQIQMRDDEFAAQPLVLGFTRAFFGLRKARKGFAGFLSVPPLLFRV